MTFLHKGHAVNIIYRQNDRRIELKEFKLSIINSDSIKIYFTLCKIQFMHLHDRQFIQIVNVISDNKIYRQ